MSDWPEWLQQTVSILLVLVPYLLWAAVCLWAINWRKMGPVLREGGWVPLALLLVLLALVWSQVRPSSVTLIGVISIGNFWWQLGAVGLLAALGLFCGWVQERYHWTPAEVATEPAAHGHGDDGHGHDDHHGPVDHAPAKPFKEDPHRKHTASHDHGRDRGGEG